MMPEQCMENSKVLTVFGSDGSCNIRKLYKHYKQAIYLTEYSCSVLRFWKFFFKYFCKTLLLVSMANSIFSCGRIEFKVQTSAKYRKKNSTHRAAKRSLKI